MFRKNRLNSSLGGFRFQTANSLPSNKQFKTNKPIINKPIINKPIINNPITEIDLLQLKNNDSMMNDENKLKKTLILAFK